MTEPILAFVLLAAMVAVSIGSAKLVSWCLDRRGESARRIAHEAAFVAQARAELAATGWTPDHEALYKADIAATKRGDLLAAAHYADQQEGCHVP
ncbi:hypothetical protein [Stenotrophomonas maltophilia]|uniref:hypothetical protein n=1 Tax=Stenotrophomonas maltophilia TaxID=40324 RepID=UPI0021C5E6B4|nr:hypothetical protein [Stenotrophomonas maltophilia]MCU1020154.1 hypothetical protein [Stenotrophomonas maltophilia]HEL3863273.1 hypothetical protein [Stenotrophomonas maltophilia]HEL4288447.1 hypothetical protein [Stenotrophomonas maltophilia]